MTRRKHRGQRLPGLFTWQADNQTVPDQDHDNPLTRRCKHCRATPGSPCTRPGPHGRRIPITGYHDCRTTPQGESTPPGRQQDETRA